MNALFAIAILLNVIGLIYNLYIGKRFNIFVAGMNAACIIVLLTEVFK